MVLPAELLQVDAIAAWCFTALAEPVTAEGL
jgi:hypothetical protein